MNSSNGAMACMNDMEPCQCRGPMAGRTIRPHVLYQYHCRDITKSYVKADIRDINSEALASSPEKSLTNTTME